MSQPVVPFNFMKKYLFAIMFVLILPAFVSAAERVDINTASLEQLETLTGIGAVKAQAIIDSRPFSSVDDLLKVKGIGEKTLQKIKEQGLACVNCGSTQEIDKHEMSDINATSQSEEVEPPIAYPDGIFINEIMASPEGPDEENEWIELYNSNNFETDLSGWKIQDSTGAQTTYIIPKNTKIAENGFLVFKRINTKITLNNDGDGLALLSPNNEIQYSISFEKSPTGRSYNKSGSVWQWSLKPTPGTNNVIILAQTAKNNKNLPKDTNSDKKDIAEAGIAGLSQANPVKNKISNGASPWFLFFTALAITIISASAVLFIKLKLNKNNVRT